MTTKILVDLSSPEHSQTSAMGKALFKLFYLSANTDMLELIDHTGCPDNGGQHSLVIGGDRSDVMAWLDMFLESFPETEPEIKAIKRLIMKESLSALHVYKVVLRDIKREFKYNGQEINRPWFWVHSQEKDFQN